MREEAPNRRPVEVGRSRSASKLEGSLKGREGTGMERKGPAGIGRDRKGAEVTGRERKGTEGTGRSDRQGP